MFRPALALLLLIPASASAAPVTRTFAFEDARLLRDGEKEGGLVHYDPTHKGALPLLIFLHGVNEAGPLHRGLGGAFDVLPPIDKMIDEGTIAPLVVAGPSQTRDAWSGARMWTAFDFDAFVAATALALPSGLTIDRSRVIVAGHSGAGCNAKGGIYSSAAKLAPMAVLALDTCMDAAFGKLMGDVAKTSTVHVFWQSAIWPRDVDGFRSAMEQVSGSSASINKLAATGANPHESIAALALETILPELVSPSDDDD